MNNCWNDIKEKPPEISQQYVVEYVMILNDEIYGYGISDAFYHHKNPEAYFFKNTIDHDKIKETRCWGFLNRELNLLYKSGNLIIVRWLDYPHEYISIDDFKFLLKKSRENLNDVRIAESLSIGIPMEE